MASSGPLSKHLSHDRRGRPTIPRRFLVVARSPDRATGPTEGLKPLTLPGCPLARQEGSWRYNPIVERYRIRADAAIYYLTYSVVEWLPVFVDAGAAVSVGREIMERWFRCSRKSRVTFSLGVMLAAAT
jgi:hypothetical protein